MEFFEYNGVPVVPSVGFENERSPRLREVKFGDGYEQVAPDGLNVLPLTFKAVFSRRTAAQAAYIDGFFTARGGHEAFLWYPPAPYNKLYIFRCKKWAHTIEEFNSETISAEIMQVFLPYPPGLTVNTPSPGHV